MGRNRNNDNLSPDMSKMLNRKVGEIERALPKVVDSLFSADPDSALSARQGYCLKQLIEDNHIRIADNLCAKEKGSVLDATQGRILQEGKVDNAEIVDNILFLKSGERRIARGIRLPSTTILNSLSEQEEGKALDAVAGKKLYDLLVEIANDIPEVTTSLNEEIPGRALDATVASDLRQAISSIETVNVVDNLRDSSEHKALSAKQGKQLYDTKIDGVVYDSATGRLSLTINGATKSGLVIDIPTYTIVSSLNGTRVNNGVLSSKLGPNILHGLNEKVEGVDILDNGKGFQLLSKNGPVGEKIMFPEVEGMDTLDVYKPGEGLLDAHQGYILNTTKIDNISIDGHVLTAYCGDKKKSIIEIPHVQLTNTLNKTTSGTALDAMQGKLLNDKIENVKKLIPEIANSLLCNNTDKALSAKQGMILMNSINDVQKQIPVVENSLTSSNGKSALSATKGRELNETKASVINYNESTRELSLYATEENTAKLSSVTIPREEVVNDLSTTDVDKALSAKQGFKLNNTKGDNIRVNDSKIQLLANGEVISSAELSSTIKHTMRDTTNDVKELADIVLEMSKLIDSKLLEPIVNRLEQILLR